MMSSQKAFTLIEVMVALMVIVFSLVAIIDSMANSTWRASYLKEKTIASWVAQNQIALYRAKKTWSNTTSYSGEVEMADTEWEWKMRVVKTPNTNIRQLEVDVYLPDDDTIIASATSFIGKL